MESVTGSATGLSAALGAGFIPDGGIYGDRKWTTEVSGSITASDVGSRGQVTKLTVNHHVWVYFADNRKPPAYYVLHHMEVSADPSVDDFSIADESDARGFFNSSVRVAYRGAPAVSTGCTVSKEFHTPKTGSDEFETVLDRLSIEMYGRVSAGFGPVVFTPSYQVRNRVDKWSLRDGGTPSWELYQREVWNAMGVDGPEQGQTNVAVPERWVRQFFDGAFGKISEMPKASFTPVTCEMITAWRIDGTFTPDSRAAVLTINVDYAHRVNLFHNGNVGTRNEPRRVCGVFSKTDESKVLTLNQIAVPHGK